MSDFTNQEQWSTQYPIIILDRAELQHYVSVAEVDRLTDQDMHTIAQTMQEELNELGFWEFTATVALRILAEKETGNGTTEIPMESLS